MKYRLLDQELEALIADSQHEQRRWLILEEDSDYPGHWVVQSFFNDFRFDLEAVMGPHYLISPATLEPFLEAAEAGGYSVAFGEEPYTVLDAFAALSETPEVALNSDFEDTTNGFLNFQVQGFNKLKNLDGAVAQWSTGTGKTVLAAGLTKYHEMMDNFDVCFFVVKAHNKINTARSLIELAGTESVILDGTQKHREAVYLELLDRFERGEKTVVITNYEKFRDDFVTWTETDAGNETPEVAQWIEPIFEARLFIVWDEMPTKLKNRNSKLYKAVVRCLYRTAAPAVNWNKRRAKVLHQIMLSATPIENSPEDWFNCFRILDGGQVYGTVTQFYDEFVSYFNHFNPTKPQGWQRLDEMILRATPFIHQVDKKHPSIASQFPATLPPETVAIDFDIKTRAAYDKLAIELVKEIEEDDEEGPVNILAAITILQMLCDAPEMVNNAATLREEWELLVEDMDEDERPDPEGSQAALRLIEALGTKLTNKGHPKLEQLREDLTVNFPDEKIIVFSRWNRAFLPMVSKLLDQWGVSHVVYRGTTAQKQAAQDAFKSDPSIRVFLSSDAGSDSINLQEASGTIHYNLPMKYSTVVQRDNRNNRITSKHARVWSRIYEMPDSVETRTAKIIEKKKQFHDATFGGVVADQAISATMTKNDLLYILTG